MQNDTVGYIIGGGLKEGFHVRLTVSAEAVQEGSFVVCDSGQWRYYGLATDLQLGATDPRFADEQPTRLQSAISQLLQGKTLYTLLDMYPTLMMEREPDIEVDREGHWEFQKRAEKGEIAPRPVKTIPAHHARVRTAKPEDIELIFSGDFVIGYTLEQKHPVRLDMGKFVKRSSGIFGATGTGKSFLTRMVLAGLIKKNEASVLVFDMHNEYAFVDRDSDNNQKVQGLQTLFGKTKVKVVAPESTVGGHSVDFTLEIGLRDFTVEDILLLSGILNLRETTAATLSAITSSLGKDWFAKFMKLKPGATENIEMDTGRLKKVPAADSVEAWADEHNVNRNAASALHNKLMRIYRRPYVRENPTDKVSTIIDSLEHGRHIIFSFGQHNGDLDYLLISNILTRRIRDHWVKKTEELKLNDQGKAKPLIIAIEEAHKLLNPQLSHQTTFGIIARELRKYSVTLLVVDQRPSGIDDEVMSQLGTRITGWLGDEDDIRAVLTGLSGRDQLRGMLARLQEKEEVLLLGWGVKMPIPVKSRRYDQDFYDDMRGRKKKDQTTYSTRDSLDGINDFNAEMRG